MPTDPSWAEEKRGAGRTLMGSAAGASGLLPALNGADMPSPVIIIPGIKGSLLENVYPIDPATTWSW